MVDVSKAVAGPSSLPQTVPAGVLGVPPAGCWQLERLEPSAELAPLIAWFWSVRWDRAAHRDHEQSTLPHPSAHLVIEDGSAVVHGPTSARFTRTLSGRGHVVAIRFQPAGLRPFLGEAMTSLADRRRPAVELFPELNDSTIDGISTVESSVDLPAAAGILEGIVARTPVDQRQLAGVERTNAVVELIAHDRSLVRVDDLAEAMNQHPRALQRDFANYVGLGPKSIIRRYRLQDAAAAALAGSAVDWAATAARLGYSDQSHLTRDFTATIGLPPAAYAARVAEAHV